MARRPSTMSSLDSDDDGGYGAESPVVKLSAKRDDDLEMEFAQLLEAKWREASGL